MTIITKKESKTLVREREGVWVKYGEGELLIARMGNPHNRKIFQKVRAPYRRQIQRGTLTDDQQAKIIAETYAESLLLDWRGQTDEEGNEIPYSKELAMAALEADIDLRDFVESTADNAALYREEEISNTAKKSPKKSDG